MPRKYHACHAAATDIWTHTAFLEIGVEYVDKADGGKLTEPGVPVNLEKLRRGRKSNPRFCNLPSAGRSSNW
jgi:hypothetical protein